MQTGIELRDRAIELLNLSHEDWIAQALGVIRAKVDAGEEFTSDDLWRQLPPAPQPKSMGAAIIGAKKLGWIRPTGRYVQSKRPAAHARVVGVWEPKK